MALPAVVAAIKDLTAEYAVEAARIASIYAGGGAVLHLREAAAKFREWQGKPLPARVGVA
jgi:hypothetical protein